MIGGRSLLSGIGLIVLALVSCAGLGTSRDNVLSRGIIDGLLLPAGYEVEASLHLSKNTEEEDYILAMSSVGNVFSAAFLTPQGIPVSSLSVSHGKVHTSRQTAIGELLNSSQILEYLELIYGEKEDIKLALGEGWGLESSAHERLYYYRDTPDSSPSTVNIVYLGSKPWFSSVSLTDSRSRLKLTIHILEAGSVLPE